MASIRVKYPPPANEADFELLCLGLLRLCWGNDKLQLFAERGEEQNGVDVYDPTAGRPHRAAQCKLHGLGKPIPPREIRAEIAKADTFRPTLEEYYILTTGRRSRLAQTAIRNLNDSRNQNEVFEVTVLTWPEIEDLLDEYFEVRDRFYDTVGGRTIARFEKALRSIDSTLETVKLQIASSITGMALQSQSPIEAGEILDRETDFLDQTIAEVESRRGVLKYTMLDAESEDWPLPVYDEWGFYLLDSSFHSLRIPASAQLMSLDDAVRKYPVFILLGDPGAGKTTALRHLTRQAAVSRKSDCSKPIPLLLSLTDWQPHEDPVSFVARHWSLSGDVSRRLREGNIWLLLDGLNELGSKRDVVTRELRKWLASPDRPARMILTCRRSDYGSNLLNADNLPIILLRDLTPEQVRTFAENYVGEGAQSFLDQLSNYSKNRGEPHSLSRFARNPYLLSALLYVFELTERSALPRSIGQLFRRLLPALWERERLRGTLGWKPFEDISPLLAKLAYEMIAKDQPTSFSVSFALEYVPDRSLLNAAASGSLLAIEDGSCRFFHQLIQEYFAAVHLGDSVLNVLPRAKYSRRHIRRQPSRWDYVAVAALDLGASVHDMIHKVAAIDPYILGLWAARADTILDTRDGVVYPH